MHQDVPIKEADLYPYNDVHAVRPSASQQWRGYPQDNTQEVLRRQQLQHASFQGYTAEQLQQQQASMRYV